MQKEIVTRPALIFALTFAWFFLLLVTTAQPIPANDAFFYDGAVVNLLLHGKYVNPSLALALPISATQTFSAYPPLYQFVLLGWMFVFGTSVISAMAFHLALFGLYLASVLAVFRRLNILPWAGSMAAPFFLILTFHDRPDSLAHLLGFLGVYFWVRHDTLATANVPNSHRWSWLMAVCVVLCLCTSLQIGSVYFFLIILLCIGSAILLKRRIPVGALTCMALTPAALAALVVVGFANLWAGFLEHARQTPSFIGPHRPAIDDLLKIIKNAPAVLAIALLFPIQLLKLKPRTSPEGRRLTLITGMTLLAALGVIVACLFVLTPNMVQITAYLQPLLVGLYLTFVFGPWSAGSGAQRDLKAQPNRWQTLHVACFLGLALLGSIRAIGMSTWGVACAWNNGCSKTVRQVRENLAPFHDGQIVVLSAAYLYDAFTLPGIRPLHSDWLQPARNRPASETSALMALKPARLILTQFDFYRRYQATLSELKTQHPEVPFKILNLAQVPAPDSIRPMRKVIQHVSWAPVIVEFSWE